MVPSASGSSDFFVLKPNSFIITLAFAAPDSKALVVVKPPNAAPATLRPVGPFNGGQKAAMTRLKEKSGKFDSQLTFLFKRETAPDGAFTNQMTETLKELEETVRANRPHLDKQLGPEPQGLSDDHAVDHAVVDAMDNEN